MVADPTAEALLAHALRYPFAAPARSFSLCGDRVTALDAGRWRRAGRVAALAYGANASPSTLAAKLGAEGALDALRGVVHGFDVVYSAHVSAYGAVPATLQRSAGTSVDAHILLLAPELLERLHASEPNYRFAALEDLSVTLDGGAEVVVDGAYVSRHGCLARERSELALAAVGARGRSLPAAPERVALTHARDRAAPGLALETFVARAVAEPAVRSRWTATLRAEAIALRRATA
jgi:hypothetical protein